MDPKPDLIREDIDETRSALTEKLETLEGQLRGTVESAKQTVEGTIENVKDSIRHLSPIYQTTQHPYLMVGGALATGLLAGRLLQSKGSEGGLSWMQPVTPSLAVERPAPDSEYVSEQVGLPRTSEYEEFIGDRPGFASAKSGPSLFTRLLGQFDDEIQMVKGMLLKGVLDAAGDAVKRSAPKWGSQIDQVVDSVAQKLAGEPRSSSSGSQRPGSERRNRGF